MLHQPPFEVAVPYLDTYLCRNGSRLQEIIQRYPAVERIVCGRMHRHMQLRFGGTLICTAPSQRLTSATDAAVDLIHGRLCTFRLQAASVDAVANV
jgi:hypothetical protein